MAKQKAMVRKRIGQNGKKRPHTLPQSYFNHAKIAEVRRKRDLAGLPPIVVEFKIPRRLQLALQVKENKEQEWGSIKAFNINQHTPDREKEEYKKKLLNDMTGWVLNGYFSANASYRIAEVWSNPQQVAY